MSHCSECEGQEVAEAMFMAIRLGIDQAVYGRQSEWRTFFLGRPNLYALKIELEKCIEQSVAVAMRRILENRTREATDGK